MRLLARQAPPRVLRERAQKWTEAWLASADERPDTSKYRHAEVVAALRGMSADKCFYCEKPLEEGEEQVDHYRDVALHRGLAYAWNNLYLACKECNVGKPSDRDLPVAGCLDPCGAVPVEDHLEFVQDRVRATSGSPVGDATIRKYRLTRRPLAAERSRVLQQLAEEYIALLERCRADGRASLLPGELARLRAYAAPTEPYSACCAAWLRARGIV